MATGCLHIVEQLAQVPQNSERVKGAKTKGQRGHIVCFKLPPVLPVGDLHNVLFGARSNGQFSSYISGGWEAMCGMSRVREGVCWCTGRASFTIMLQMAKKTSETPRKKFKTTSREVWLQRGHRLTTNISYLHHTLWFFCSLPGHISLALYWNIQNSNKLENYICILEKTCTLP